MLNSIVADKRIEVAERKVILPQRIIEMGIQQGRFAFSEAIRQKDFSLVAECKLASPAKGQLCSTQTVMELARIYSLNGATALSVHTSRHFKGELADIGRVRAVSKLPLLRKDFIIDEYQIYEARWAGADAILLIAAILSDNELKKYLAIAAELGLDCLVETHSREELKRAHAAGAILIGINNRDLRTFKTDIHNTLELFPECSEDKYIISESGIASAEDALLLKRIGVRGILVGEGLVTAADIAAQTRKMAWPGLAEDDECATNVDQILQ